MGNAVYDFVMYSHLWSLSSKDSKLVTISTIWHYYHLMTNGVSTVPRIVNLTVDKVVSGHGYLLYLSGNKRNTGYNLTSRFGCSWHFVEERWLWTVADISFSFRTFRLFFLPVYMYVNESDQRELCLVPITVSRTIYCGVPAENITAIAWSLCLTLLTTHFHRQFWFI